jgi:DNA-binding LacI/PurR family transcriptional regulator
MAAQAAGMLFGKADPDAPASSVLPHRLVARESTAAPKR